MLILSVVLLISVEEKVQQSGMEPATRGPLAHRAWSTLRLAKSGSRLALKTENNRNTVDKHSQRQVLCASLSL